MTDFIFRYRWFIIIICLLIGAGSLVVIPRTKIDPEIRNYVPRSLESRSATDKIENEFGVQDLAVILFIDSCIITHDNIQSIRNIDHSISRINGVSSRMSLFTVKDMINEEGYLKIDPLVKDIPRDNISLNDLKGKILRNRFARDIVISSDLTTASITATINNSVREKSTLQKIDSIINCYESKVLISKGGLPYIRQNLLEDVGNDAIILVPAALLIMLIILRLNLGTWRSVIMPFSVVVLTTAFSLALIPLAGLKMSVITLLVPIILIAVANNYGIYLIARYQELKRQFPEGSKRDMIRSILKSLNMPILFSGLTTIAGILGLLTHSVIPARQVGMLAASGVTLALFMSLFFIPALISISGKGLNPGNKRAANTRLFDSLFEGLSNLIIRKPGSVLLVSGIVTILISSGIIYLRINTNQEEYFSKNHPIRKASEIINSKFGGSQSMSVMIKGDIIDPGIMNRIDSLSSQLEKEKGVGRVFSISQVLREMSKVIFTSTEAGYNKIPETREGIAQMFELYNMSGNQDDFKQLLNPEYTKAQILVRLSEPETGIIRSVKDCISSLTKNLPAEVLVGGYALIMADFSESIIKGQVLSLLFAVITVFFLLAIIFRSFSGGAIGSIPLFASILILFGFMGFAKIALDAATALLSSIMIGVGVDFTIQYIWCFNLQIRSGLSYPEATVSAIKTIGRSILINGLSVMAGFSALVFSGFTSIRFFGYLVMISIGVCLVGALLIIPALLMKFKPGFIGFQTDKRHMTKHEKESNFIGIGTAAFSGSLTET